MAEDENKTECPTCPTCQSCTKWKVGFIMCLICSLIKGFRDCSQEQSLFLLLKK